ncbi:vezatin isoform X2 [Dryobates pubescens]|uniref:vezatin isoform X2 n=1 Tax=Dryobates pubescens TaxID=118200 RepID=UPI0023B9020A|nr:vezatin isoform X2 [Dryobates pubescens]
MTPEFDEEVVFENSPLYQYLQDLGHTDFEACSSVSQRAELCAAAESQKERAVPAAHRQGILSKLAELLRSCFPFPHCKRNEDILHRLDLGFRADTLRTILHQEVLLQEDVELMEFLDPSILAAGQCKHQDSRQLPTLRSLAAPSLWDVSLLLAFLSAVFVLPSCWKEPWGLPWGLLLLGYAALRLWGTWRTARLQRSLRRHCVQLEETVASSRAFTNLVRKALRLIQETEVISRGFTLVSAACPFTKAGQHPSQQLPGLRRAVYRAVAANLRAARLATLYMLKAYPLNSESDNVSSYICVVPFKELGLGLSEEQVSEEEAHNLTDGFSLPALKVLFQLWVGQSSEFFRRLALLLSPANASPTPLLCPDRLPHRILSDVTRGLPGTQAACLEELRRSYEFYRYFQTQPPAGGERPARAARQRCGQLGGLQTALRSLQLHLKALLNEVIILEDELEKLVSTKETAELTTEAHQALEQKLKFIQPHMQASNSCWEEAISQVERMSGRNPKQKGKPEVSCASLQHTAVPLSQPAIYIENRDPVPEEQELEAYVDYSDSESEHRREDFYCFSQEERERQERERQESKRVLQELKSVLGFKASELERQKWKQLLFSDHAAVKPLSPVEPLKLLNNGESHMTSAAEQQNCSQRCDRAGETDSDPKGNAADKSRTEHLSEDPEVEENKGSAAEEGLSVRAEAGMCNQQQGEDLKASSWDGAEDAEPAWKDALHSKIKHRLAQLHTATDLTFTAGLAAQAAARSFTFTAMQEETFGDEEEECEEPLEDCESEERGSESEGKC